MEYWNLFRNLNVIRVQSIESGIYRLVVRVLYCWVRVSQTRVRARVRVFPKSGFSSGQSPVRVSKYAQFVCRLVTTYAFLRVYVILRKITSAMRDQSENREHKFTCEFTKKDICINLHLHIIKSVKSTSDIMWSRSVYVKIMIPQ